MCGLLETLFNYLSTLSCFLASSPNPKRHLQQLKGKEIYVNSLFTAGKYSMFQGKKSSCCTLSDICISCQLDGFDVNSDHRI